jgi:hypothetical protein
LWFLLRKVEPGYTDRYIIDFIYSVAREAQFYQIDMEVPGSEDIPDLHIHEALKKEWIKTHSNMLNELKNRLT